MLKTLRLKLFTRRASRSIIYTYVMYNGNIQQNSLCVEFCVTEEFNISPRFSLHLRLPAVVAKLAMFPRL